MVMTMVMSQPRNRSVGGAGSRRRLGTERSFDRGDLADGHDSGCRIRPRLFRILVIDVEHRRAADQSIVVDHVLVRDVVVAAGLVAAAGRRWAGRSWGRS